jgi:hypothetical protein
MNAGVHACSTPDFGSYRCNCTAGWTGENCGDDIDECASAPCQNGGGCLSSNENSVDAMVAADVHRCDCEKGWTGENCADDVDECTSAPCMNGATCVESTASDVVPVDAFSCSCADGFANGVCQYDDQLDQYEELCNKTLGAQCNIDVDECQSNPCQNEGTCLATGISNWQVPPSSTEQRIYTSLCPLAMLTNSISKK